MAGSDPLAPADVRRLAEDLFSPPARPLVGLEVEWVVHPDDDPYRRASLADLQPLTLAPLPRGGRVSVEPGGQLEVSTEPAGEVDVVLDRLAADEASLRRRLAGLGLRPWATPVDRLRAPQRILDVGRYRAMEAFFDADGPAGRWMMTNTASVQVNLGHDPADPERSWRMLHRLAPVLAATFADAPGRDRSGQEWASLRQAVWLAIDPSRTTVACSDLPAARAWAEYALDAHVMFVRDGDEVSGLLPGTSLRDWLAGALHRPPTIADLRQHLTTLFPPVRPRGWLELRVLDALPPAAREVAVLVTCAAMRPEAAAALEADLPDDAGSLADAARHGLSHPALAAAADVVFDVAVRHLPAVTAGRGRIEAVSRYRREVVDARRQPWQWEPATRTHPAACAAAREAVPAPGG